MQELPKQYRPAEHEDRIFDRWMASKAFHADPAPVLSGEREPYCVLIPPPNVTAALHLGHALNNTIQDILVRAHRMMGYETLWMPGTDHAGIATQAVVEKRVMKEEKKRRTDFTREAFIAKIQAFKDEYEATITNQLKKMGCSCDWERQRFTMDPICARAVREAFFRLFRDGLIYRGKRLVNWDPVLQTAVADDECYDEEVDTSFWNMRYPLSAPVTLADGTVMTHVTVATTRPETYLADTGIAMNPKDPRAAALVGKTAVLPMVGRVIPIIADPYAVLPESLATTEEEKNDPKAKFSTGFVKMTPAHDFNDYEIGVRHKLAIVNMMSPDGRVSDQHGWDNMNMPAEFKGLKMSDARKKVVEAFEAQRLMAEVRPYRQGKTFSDRSKAVIEPYLSDQWYVRVTDDRLAGAANRALVDDQRSSGGPSLRAGREPQRHTILDEGRYPAFRAEGFEPKDPYPAGQPTPSTLIRTRHFLPHLQLPNATYFVTWRAAQGVTLTDAERTIALDAIRHFDGERIHLFAASVMPDHAHCLVRCAPGVDLPEWCASVKRFSSTQVNKERGRQGSLWQAECFDHIVRDQGYFAEFLEYIAFNPVADGLVENPSEYPWTFVADHVIRSLKEKRPGPEGRATKDGDGSLRFHPARYSRTYELWHDNIRDWCISRQLWWGHRIPVWVRRCDFTKPTEKDSDGFTMAERLLSCDTEMMSQGELNYSARFVDTASGEVFEPTDPDEDFYSQLNGRVVDAYICVRDETWNSKFIEHLERFGGFTRDPDVLDTWFSSALWPISTMGWPEGTDELRAFNPSSTLCTAREIITLWVSRMVMFNRYFRPLGTPSLRDGSGGSVKGETGASGSTASNEEPPRSGGVPKGGEGNGPVPFRDVFIHSVIQDGEGRKMSKTLGNGVDPLDIIATHGADAMRFTLCHMTTQTQDVRLPVVKDSASGKNTSPKFDLGRNFANKLWNAARFALGILGSATEARSHGENAELSLVDRWMLSRLAAAVDACNTALAEFQFADYATTMYDLLWRDFCDWYLEAIKPTVAGDPRQRAVLAATLDTILRLLHPVMPYVTEAIYEQSRTLRTDAVPGIELGDARKDGLLATAGWPRVSPTLRDDKAEREFEELRGFITAIREVRAQHNVQPKRKVTLHFPGQLLRGGSFLGDLMDTANPVHVMVPTLAGVATMINTPPKAASVTFSFGGHEFKVSDLADEATMDAGAERARLEKLVADLDKSIATFEGRLANPGYALKAPPAMVQQTKDQLEKAKTERAAAAATLAQLG